MKALSTNFVFIIFLFTFISRGIRTLYNRKLSPVSLNSVNFCMFSFRKFNSLNTVICSLVFSGFYFPHTRIIIEKVNVMDQTISIKTIYGSFHTNKILYFNGSNDFEQFFLKCSPLRKPTKTYLIRIFPKMSFTQIFYVVVVKSLISQQR